MNNLKDDIVSALEQYVTMDLYQDYPAIFQNKKPANTNLDTYIVYQLINNQDTFYADNRAIKEYIHFQISGFTRSRSTTDFGNEINTAMTSLGFIRSYIGEMYEDDTGYEHVSTRYKIKVNKEAI